jgi:hypothetical protein
MSSSDFIKEQYYGWSVALPASVEEKPIHAEESLTSVIDDIAAFNEGREEIPRTEVIPTGGFITQMRKPQNEAAGSALDSYAGGRVSSIKAIKKRLAPLSPIKRSRKVKK